MLLAVTIFYGYYWRTFAQAPLEVLLPVMILFVFATTGTVYCCRELIKRYKTGNC